MGAAPHPMPPPVRSLRPPQIGPLGVSSDPAPPLCVQATPPPPPCSPSTTAVRAPLLASDPPAWSFREGAWGAWPSQLHVTTMCHCEAVMLACECSPSQLFR